MKKIIIVLGVAVGLGVLAVVAILILANPNSHRELIQSQLETQLNRKVTLGDMSLGFLPLRFQVKNAVIADDPALAAKEPFIQADQLDVRIGLLSLLRGSVQVDSVDLHRPKVELIRTRKGDWNFATLGPKAAPSSGAVANKSSGSEFSLNRLTISDGQIGVTDLQKNQPRTGYDHIDLTLLGYAPGKPFSFDLAAHIQGEGAQEIRLKGTGGPVASNNPADTPFEGKLNLTQVGVDGLMKFIDNQVVTQAKGTLSGESNVTSRSGNVTASGKLKLDKAQVNKLEIGYPIQFDYNLAAKTAEGLITIDNATLQLGQTPLSVSGIVRTATTPIGLDLKIKSGDASIAEIARLASAFGVAFAPGTTVNGRVSADVAVKGTTSQPFMTGTITGRDLKVSGQGIPQPVEVKAIDLALSPTAIQSNEFNATSGKSTVNARFGLLNYASKSPALDLGLKAPGATLPEIQAIAKAYGVTGLDPLSGTGSLNFDLNANGPVASLTGTSAAKALNGVINLDFSPLKLAGFDTAYELGKLGGFASSLTDQNATDIVKVTGQILVKSGIAQTDNLKLQLGIGNLAGSGTADLASEELNMKLSAVLTKAFSDKVAGSRAGFMNVAFTNNEGEIVLPALVTGNFKKPKFAPDLKAVAQLQKQKFIPTLDNPAGAVNNVLGLLKGKNEPPASPEQQPAQPAQPASETKKPSGLKGLLDALGKKKP